MSNSKSNAAWAAAIIMLVFGGLAYFMPTIMLAVGARSQVLAVIIPVVFVLGFFAVFWLHARSKRNR